MRYIDIVWKGKLHSVIHMLKCDIHFYGITIGNFGLGLVIKKKL